MRKKKEIPILFDVKEGRVFKEYQRELNEYQRELNEHAVLLHRFYNWKVIILNTIFFPIIVLLK